MWSSAARFAPVAAAAVCLTRPRKGRRSGQDVGFACGPHAQISCCKESSERRRTITQSSIGKHFQKSLLAQRDWIYRLVSSESINNIYTFERVLGTGGFATVYLGRHKQLDLHRAVKKIPKEQDDDEEELMQEIFNLMNLDHPHIIKLVRTHDDGENLYIVSELCKGPALFDRIIDSPMSEQEAGVALRHMVKAVQCCHSHYMGHYDIKPENFMYSDNDCKNLKMIDLGLSSGFKRDPGAFKGTVAYVAPEVFSGMYGPEADIWSCGAVLFAMLTQKSLVPIDASMEKVAELLQDRRSVADRLATHSRKLSPECKDLLRKMLLHDRHMRITAADILQHPFITKTYIQPTKKKDIRMETAALNVIKAMGSRFTDFGTEPVIVRAALGLMVHIAGYMTGETRPHRMAYSMLDRSGSGELSLDSIEAMMLEYNLEVPQNLHEAFQAVDLDQNGYITYGDFLSATLPLRLRCREDLCHRVFNLLDRNQDGFIDRDDLAVTFLSKGEMGSEGLRQLCSLAIDEVSNSSQLGFDEFLRLMLGRNPLISASDFDQA